jgi:hypothetical protein
MDGSCRGFFIWATLRPRLFQRAKGGDSEISARPRFSAAPRADPQASN